MFIAVTFLRASLFRCRTFVLCACCVSLAGCASLRFKPIRQSRFVNMDVEVLRVEYGHEKRTETLPNGLVCAFDSKVRVRLPDGERIVLYQTLATSGVRYVSHDKQYEFNEKGPYCILRHQGKTLFEGIYCRK